MVERRRRGWLLLGQTRGSPRDRQGGGWRRGCHTRGAVVAAAAPLAFAEKRLEAAPHAADECVHWTSLGLLCARERCVGRITKRRVVTLIGRRKVHRGPCFFWVRGHWQGVSDNTGLVVCLEQRCRTVNRDKAVERGCRVLHIASEQVHIVWLQRVLGRLWDLLRGRDDTKSAVRHAVRSKESSRRQTHGLTLTQLPWLVSRHPS